MAHLEYCVKVLLLIYIFSVLQYYNNSQIWVQVPMRSPKDCSEYTDCVRDEEQVMYIL